jgi:hypothetical protein
MKTKLIVLTACITFISSCASEFGIASSDVPQPVLDSFNSKYPGATNIAWEVEKENGKLYFEAEFKFEGKEKEAYFRPDGSFTKEE